LGNDIEIRVRVANQSAAGMTSLARSMRSVRDEARNASQGLDRLTRTATAASAALQLLHSRAEAASRALRELEHHSTAASAALRELRDGTTGTNNSLRTLNTRTQTAHNRLDGLADRTRQLRSDTDDLDGSMRRLTTTMGGLRGSAGSVRTSVSNSSDSMGALRSAALMLAPALIPIAASAAPIAVNLAAAGVAVGAFGLAVAGQISAINDASDAQKKYDEAVKQHGQASDQATKAEAAYLAQVKELDPETRRSAAALTVLKDTYKQWSKDLAGSTMPVFTKGMANLGALLPQMAPLVRSTATELDRLMTVLAGGINSKGFSEFMSSFSTFASGALSKATDQLVHFMRVVQGGAGKSQLTEFMAYVREVGPQVGETLANLGRALTHLVAAASDTGVSLLTVVNSFAKLVNAIPTGTLSNLLQFVVVFKAVKMAALGLGGAGGAITGFMASLTAMRAASTAAGGGLSGLAAAFGTLSRAAKVAVIGTAVGALVVALTSLSEMGKKAPPDIDRMTTSLGKLAQTGELSGEAARVFGKDYEKLGDALATLARPSTLDKIQQGLTSLIGMDSTPVKDAKDAFDGLDKGLTNLVRGGKANLAAEALKMAIANLKKQGYTSKEVTSQLDDYKSALADQAFEQQLAAQSMGLFGEQALKVQQQLNEQKQSADGLRQSIEALNDANRSALGGMIGFEASIDTAAKAAKDNAGALSMVNGHLDVNSPKAQAAATALNDLAAKTKDAALASREATGSWEGAIGIYERGRQQFLKNAEAMGLTEDEAELLASQIMQIPDTVKLNTEDAQNSLEAFNAAVQKTPGTKAVTLQTLSKGAESILEAFGMKVQHLPNGSVKVTAKNGQALSGIADVAGAISRLDGRTATTYVTAVNTTIYRTKGSLHDVVGGATGGLYSGKAFRYADGGMVSGPGTGTSDDVFAPWLSNGEFVIKAASVRKYGERFLQSLNDGQLQMPRYASGGLVTKSQLRGLSSPSDVAGLTSTIGEVRSSIKERTSGATESRLLRVLDSVGKKLIANEKSLTSVNKALDGAKTKLNDLKSSAAQLASSVKGGILSTANITSGAQGKNVTVGSILQGLTDNRDQAVAFSNALAGLKSKGLRGDLIQQIAEAGIGGGGLETAQALMSAGTGDLSAVNSLQGQIAAAAGAAGKTASDAVYAAAIKAQTASMGRLQRSQDKLEATMSALAKSLGRALGGKAAGGIVGGAASGGIRSNRTWVGEHGPELLDLPAGSRVWSAPDSRRRAAAWESMLNSPRRSSHSAGSGGGGGPVQLVVVHQTIELDGRVVARQMFEPLKEEIRGKGGNVQNALGQPGRG